ncbi:(Fe-S)-binding protein [Saccharopolyspora sp. ASAGF58]|uniref:(Fe-S)-binding protein n=1 Tax=Saccharopolyspora sp. ASAGF58 TaxID=2719023 RepID=UPI001B307FFD|nr:(Fe-S)-binding protein [Saccharopolyspora sp. ASAGF58]
MSDKQESQAPTADTGMQSGNGSANGSGNEVDLAMPKHLGDVEQAFVEKWHENATGCFSSGHKFCREVCPVTQVTRNENHTPTAFHANVIALEKGHLSVEDVADDYVHCTQCGGCEVRCPNTLMVGDFYRARTETVKVVRAMRAMLVDKGLDREKWKVWNRLTNELKNEPVLGVEGDQANGQAQVRDWGEGLNIPIGGETIMFVDCEAAYYRTSVPRATAQILQKAGVEFGLMNEQWCCGGPAAEMGYVEQSMRFARHNVDDWRRSGVKRIIAIEPHDYVHFTEDYPAYFGEEFDFEVVQIIDLVAELIRDGRLELVNSINRVATYHDPCRLNKRKGIHEAPREILRAIPGLDFRDVDRVTQWSYCSGGGGGLPIEKPEITGEISRRRLEQASTLDVDLLVSACVWSERPLTAAGDEAGIEVRDIIELVAESAGIEIGGRTRA